MACVHKTAAELNNLPTFLACWPTGDVTVTTAGRHDAMTSIAFF